MAASKHDRVAAATAAEYAPMQWVQRSGFDVDSDARATAAIDGPTPAKKRERRNHEIRRLASFHGKEWASKVQDRVIQLFKAAEVRS